MNLIFHYEEMIPFTSSNALCLNAILPDNLSTYGRYTS